MKKKKNRGFAITALLYGLSILGFAIVILIISIMQSKRSATIELTEAIEEELSKYGEVNQTYTESGTQTLPLSTGAEGYYLVELCGGGGQGDYVSGMMYLDPSLKYDITIGSGDTTISYNGEVIMRAAGKSSTAGSIIKGLAKFNETYKNSNYPTMAFNGQIKENVYTENIGKLTINKVSDSFPINRANDLFLQSNCYLQVIAGDTTRHGASKVEADIVKIPKRVVEGEVDFPPFKSLIDSGNSIKVTSDYYLSDVYVSKEKIYGWFGYNAANYDDFQITYNDKRLSMEVNLWYKSWWSWWWSGSRTGSSVSVKVMPDNVLGGFEFQIFNPYSRESLKDGNYFISQAAVDTTYTTTGIWWWKKTYSEDMYRIDLSNFLTSAYINNDIEDNYDENDSDVSKLVLLQDDDNGNQVFGKKVLPTKTVSSSSQKWYIESVKNDSGGVDHFIIADMNDHKLLELNENNCTASSSGSKVNQSVLINGKYKALGSGLEAVESANNDQLNQKWDLIEAGLGLWYIKSTVCDSIGKNEARFVKCTAHGCTLTNDSDEASLFSIINADI